MQREVEKPQILLAIDNSESILLRADSSEIKKSIESVSEILNDKLSDKFEVINATFGEGVNLAKTPDFQERESDIGGVLTETGSILNSSLAKGIILISDGIYNSGRHPGYTALKSKVPVNVLALGDTSVRRDLRVQTIRVNSISFLGNEFPIEVDVTADEAKGQISRLSIWKNGVKLGEETVTINSDRFAKSYKFQLKADQIGSLNYVVRLGVVDGESNVVNNSAYASTEVIDAKQRILLNCHAPHPDVAALRSVLEKSDQYELEVRIADLRSVNSDEFDLVITHSMPVQGAEVAYINGLGERKIPHLAILGSTTNISQWNQLEDKMKILGNRSNFNQVLPAWNKEFNYFNLEDETKAFINKYPPLIVPFGQFQVADELGICMYQKIGAVETQMPLISLRKKDGLKNAVLCGEGIWRWRFYEYEQRGDHQIFDEFFKKLFQYLALKEDKRKFRVSLSKKSYFENDRIAFRAEVYNENYEPINTNSIDLKLRDEEGNDFSYNFLPQGNYYKVEAGNLPVGNYSYVAKTTISGRAETISGRFSVRPLVLEALNLSANHKVLRQISENSGGIFFYLNQAEELAQKLNENQNSSAIVRSTVSFKDVIDLKWLFALIFGLLSLEWISRRWSGSY